MLNLFGHLIGGLGLLLIGMGLMTDGLKLAAGNTLRDILALWTNTRLRGLFSGFLITGIVQSSSAVTVATIGFANAGMLSLERALWVIFGSNVGTTMTAWIVALIGFKLNIEAFALPLVGIGTLMKFSGSGTRRSSLGLAMVGFGLLFLGIDALKSAFDTAGTDFSIPETASLSLLDILMYVGIGFMLTTLMQSSSASMVIALSAAESGLLPFNAAAAMVIGANLGTTTTSIIAVFGATPTAKRVALGHVSFNVITAVVAVMLLVPMLALGSVLQAMLGVEESPAIDLAIFHTSFNVLGVLLMWPLSNRMVSFLHARFLTDEETESKPKFLDKNTLALPYIAVDALTLELSRIANYCIHLLQLSLRTVEGHAWKADKAQVIRNLCAEAGSFSAQLNKTELTPYLSEALLSLMHSTQEYLLTVDIAEDLALLNGLMPKYQDSEFHEQLAVFISTADRHLGAMTPDNSAETINKGELYAEVEKTYTSLKEAILLNASFGNLTIADMDQLLQYANQVKRGCRHLWKAARRLSAVRESLQRNAEGEVVQSSVSDASNIELLKDTAATLAEDKEHPVAETG